MHDMAFMLRHSMHRGKKGKVKKIKSKKTNVCTVSVKIELYPFPSSRQKNQFLNINMAIDRKTNIKILF